jgi:hypothetical protein
MRVARKIAVNASGRMSNKINDQLPQSGWQRW